MKINVEIDEDDVRRLVFQRLTELMPDAGIKLEEISFLVKSKNNYREQNWENGQLRVSVERVAKS